jgi:hypothetical protein
VHPKSPWTRNKLSDKALKHWPIASGYQLDEDQIEASSLQTTSPQERNSKDIRS